MIEQQEDRIKALTSLGLTYTQARIYLANLQAGPTTAKIISQIANVAREDVYRVLPTLLKMGLTKKHLASPTVYEAIRPEQATAILLRRKEKEYADAQQKGKDFVKHFQSEQIENSSYKTDEKIVWITSTEKNPIDPMLMDSIRKTKRSLDFTTRYNLFAYSMNNPALKKWIRELYKAVQRGVEIRMVLDKPKSEKLVSELSFTVKNSKSLVENSRFKYKYLQDAPECILIVFDNDMCLIETSTAHDVSVSPYLWTNNQVLVNLSKTYFGMMWDSAADPVLTN